MSAWDQPVHKRGEEESVSRVICDRRIAANVKKDSLEGGSETYTMMPSLDMVAKRQEVKLKVAELYSDQI